ncbi:amino acid decarboxylase [Kitasatospora griseola]|uniref:Amino acid decarboxylase n=1 Tax=Kitasatospora griseola TaxID=2064 RepID=A0A0D0ND72_KITGR|nr:pyridoxal-dependent decarboxylase [Kitasatospora griseola]KIQ66150.1 amino acid decarboxylase [Kitasatospora griseola]
MSEDFESAAAQAVARLTAHWAALESLALPVEPAHAPGATARALPASAPERGEPLERILADTWSVVVPGLVHWQHPAFLGYYPTANSPASVLAELVTAGLGVQGMMWSTSPAATELEQVVVDWLAKALGLPGSFLHSGGTGGGVIQDSASSAVLVAIVAALHRASGGGWRTDGVDGRYRAYCTGQANSCVPKAVRIAGLGEPVEIATTAGTGAMDPHALAARLDADRRAGLVPTVVVATSGTTATCAFDPLPAVADVCRRHGVWLHVDGAYAGSAALCPEHRAVNDGLEAADSYAVNAHKWMRTGTPCDVLWTSDRASLTEAMAIRPAFLHNPATESGAVVDFRDWQIPLGRPMRALKLWYVLRAHGLEGLRAAVRHDVGLAGRLARTIDREPGFHLVAHELGLVAFRYGTDGQTRALAARLAADTGLVCTPAEVEGRPLLRAVFGSPYATEATVDQVWAAIRRHAQAC